jgi:DNA-binding MarR family transcriptional regulator
MIIEEEIKQTKFKSIHQKVILNLLFTANWIENKQRELFEPFGITGQQYNILRILRGQHPNRINGAEIRSRMLDKNSDVSRLLDRLISKNLIDRTSCPNDKRASHIGISHTGLLLLKQLDTEIERSEKKILPHLSQEELTLLSNLLDRGRG